ncbi:MAG: NUDIX domain-containing protein [Flavobacteriaceae bacterium]|nr:NUDIX domain-containing protein [Flavobacteriaceae bacterium]
MKFAEWIESQENDIQNPPKVLWITGMGSTGFGPKQLALQGYEVKHIGTTTNRYAAYLGRFKRFPMMGSLFGGHADRLGKSHLAVNAQKHDMEKDQDFQPDVVVGSSQGGAVTMEIAHQYPKAKFVLIAPAWKIFGADPSHLPADTIIVHGKKDIQVPPVDSQILQKKFGFKVLLNNFGHTVPFQFIKQAIDMQLPHRSPVPQFEQFHRVGKDGHRYWGRVGGGIIFTDGEKILLLQRADEGDYAGYWCIPGGKSKKGELPIDTARRESREECGKNEGQRFGHFDTKDGLHHFHTYLYSVPKPFDVMLSNEHTAFRWVPIDDVEEMQLHPKFKENWLAYSRAIRKNYPTTAF